MMKEELNVLAVALRAREPRARVRRVPLKPNFRTLGQKGRGKEAQKLKGVMGSCPRRSRGADVAARSRTERSTVDGIELEPRTSRSPSDQGGLRRRG